MGQEEVLGLRPELAQQSAHCFRPVTDGILAINGKINTIRSRKEGEGQISFRGAIFSDSDRRIIHPGPSRADRLHEHLPRCHSSRSVAL